MPWRVEERWPTSPDWTTAYYSQQPVIKNNRIVLTGSVGPRVRSCEFVEDKPDAR